ncbi:MAG: type pilus assembly protein PilQ [Cyanobacteriota bacterium]
MKNYYNPLMLGGFLACCLITAPARAAWLEDFETPGTDQVGFEHPLLISQTPTQPSVMVPNPQIIIEGGNGVTAQTSAGPTLPRAIAPPVGDIAISNINAAPEKLNLGGASFTIPRVLLREASAREVLMTLANYAGYNVVFTDASGEQASKQTVSLEFTNESVENIFNSVLLVSGLQANLRGKTIFVGGTLPQGARNIISRTLRLNQAKSINAATFLATQGAEYQRLVSQTEDIVDPFTQRVIGRRDIPAELQALTVTPSEGSTAPLLLSGLMVAADDRLNAVTMIGEARKVEIASSLLTQLDARRRQVVVNVKVIDINLLNTEFYDSSFSFGFNDGFVTQDSGAAIVNFGGNNPPNRAQATTGAFARPVIPLSSTIVGEATLTPFFDRQNQAPFDQITPGPNDFTNSISPYARPNFGTNNNPFQPGLSNVDIDPTTGQITYEYQVPDLFQYPKKFLASLEAQITSGNAKILTDPSLVVQEGQLATVKLTEKVIESVNTQVDPLSGVRTITPVLSDAGLTLAVNVERIDDNGFISLIVSPTIATPVGQVEFSSGGLGSTNTLTLLGRRELTSGLVRLRDGQTLILSGIIQEDDRLTERKVPILGDIPILGALFRSRNNTYNRTEVIILLTPRILEDNTESTFGYNYEPGPDTTNILRRQGFPVQRPQQP